MPENRWDRLAAELQAAGYDVRIDERRYPDPRTRTYKVSRSITFHVPGAGCVSVIDQWWRKNDSVWIGWSVCAEDREGITLGHPFPLTKKRSETIAAFKAALKRLPAATGAPSGGNPVGSITAARTNLDAAETVLGAAENNGATSAELAYLQRNVNDAERAYYDACDNAACSH